MLGDSFVALRGVKSGLRHTAGGKGPLNSHVFVCPQALPSGYFLRRFRADVSSPTDAWLALWPVFRLVPVGTLFYGAKGC